MPFAQRRAAGLALLCLYPAYWVAPVLVNALPALAVLLISGREIAELRAGWTGVAVATAIRGWGVVIPTAVCAIGFIWLSRRGNAVLWSVMLAMMGLVSAMPALV